MDDSCWLEDEFLTVLQQSSVLQSSVPLLDDIDMEQEFLPTSTEIHARRRTLSLGDSASSEIAMPTHPREPYSLSRWVETGNQTEKKSKKDGKDLKKVENYSGRSWSGSPKWDFKEGCSYDVQNYRTSGALEEIKKSNEISIRWTLLPPLKMNSSGKNQTIMLSLLQNNQLGKDPMSTSRFSEGTIVDSARDARFPVVDEMFWAASPSLGRSLSSSSHSRTSESSSVSISSQSVGNDSSANLLDQDAPEENNISFLARVKNECDLALLEGSEEEYEDDVESLDAYSTEYSSDHLDHASTSGLGRLLSLVVGIGAGAIFQIMK